MFMRWGCGHNKLQLRLKSFQYGKQAQGLLYSIPIKTPIHLPTTSPTSGRHMEYADCNAFITEKKKTIQYQCKVNILKKWVGGGVCACVND